jgi:hypothetical protein
VEGFEPRPLSLRLCEVIRVGKRQADMSCDVLQKLHVPVVESVRVIRLQRQHGGDALSA